MGDFLGIIAAHDGASALVELKGGDQALVDPAVAANPANTQILTAVRDGTPVALDDSSFLATADPTLARPILDGFAGSMSVVFMGAAAVLFIGLFAVIMMKELPLRTQSGVDARRDEDAAPVGAAVPTGDPDGTRDHATDGSPRGTDRDAGPTDRPT